MNPQVIIAALPWVRRVWRLTPPQLRVPLLLIAGAVGIAQFVMGRRQQDDTADAPTGRSQVTAGA